jgi:hypothetical protein
MDFSLSQDAPNLRLFTFFQAATQDLRIPRTEERI